MKFVIPVDITSAMLTSNVPEADYPAWAVGTAYAAAARVIMTSTHRIYEAIAPSTGKQPDLNPDLWRDVDPTNRWGMFDRVIETKTTTASPITVTITPGQVVAGLFMLNVSAASVRVQMHNAGVQVYDKTVSLMNGSNVKSWYDFYFAPILRRRSVRIVDLPPYLNGVITVTVSDPSGPVSVGALVVGPIFVIGQNQFGAEGGLRDFSVKATNEFGRTYVAKRPFKSTLRTRVIVPTGAIDIIKEKLQELRATPLVYFDTETVAPEMHTVYGFATDFSVIAESPVEGLCNLTLESLT